MISYTDRIAVLDGTQVQTTFLDVGHGGGVVLEIDGRNPTIVDCAVVRPLTDFLRGRGYENDEGNLLIERLIVTHFDNDHFAGVTQLMDLAWVEIGSIHFNPNMAQASEDPDHLSSDAVSDFWEKVIKRSDLCGGASRICFVTSDLDLDLHNGDVRLEILWPPDVLTMAPAATLETLRIPSSRNALSVVCALLLGGKPEVLLTGDVEKGSIEKLISTQSHRLAAPILQVPHHAGKVDKIEKFSREAHGALASVVQPTIAIAQTGRNRYDNPRLSTIAGLLEAEGPVPYIACSQLNTKCGDADEGNKHCAGTVSVLHGMGVVHFGRSEHHEFVAEACKGKARCKLSLPEIEELLAEDR